MSFQWSDFMTLAQALSTQAGTSADPEAYQRSAISRAYYACYNQARDVLSQDGVIVPSSEAHRFVIDEFLNSSSRDRRWIGQLLLRLRDRRNSADYDLQFRYGEITRETLRVMQDARTVAGALRRL